MIEISAVVITYNSQEAIEATINQLEASLGHLNAEIIAVDNASKDNTVSVLKRCIRRGRIIELAKNVGYGPGLNVGISMAAGKRVLLMNDDIRLTPDCINALIRALDSSDDIAMVGPQIVFQDGRQAPAARPFLPGWRDEFARLVDRITGRRTRTAYPTSGDAVDVGLLVAACLMGKTEVLRSLGGFNGSFFFYGEDIDLCRRLRDNGYRCVLAPRALAIHHHEVAPDRRYRGQEFSTRILKARDMYYRIWLSRPSRMLLNLYRAIGPTDQPLRFSFHVPRAIYDGPNVTHLRHLQPLVAGMTDPHRRRSNPLSADDAIENAS
jgi:GT2 family glycosyltransferase